MGRWGGTGRLGRRELQRRQNLLGTVRKKKGANKGEVPLRALQLRVEGQKSLPFIRGVKSLGPAKDITQVWSGSAILSLQLLQTQCLAWGQKGKRRKEQAFLRGGFVMGVSQTPVTCQAVQTAGDAGLTSPALPFWAPGKEEKNCFHRGWEGQDGGRWVEPGLQRRGSLDGLGRMGGFREMLRKREGPAEKAPVWRKGSEGRRLGVQGLRRPE